MDGTQFWTKGYSNIKLAYSALQAGYTTLDHKFLRQHSPSRINEIVRSLFSIADFFALIGDVVQFEYKLAHRRNDRENDPLRRPSLDHPLFRAVGVISLAFAAVWGFNRLTRPSTDLNQFLSTASSAHVIVKAGWELPISHFISQWILTSRVFVSLAFRYQFPGDWKNICSLICQYFSWNNIGRLKGIALEQIASNHPLENISFNITTENDKQDYIKNITKLKSKFFLLIESKHSNDSSYLSSVIQSIQNYSSSYFQNSTWSHYWTSPIKAITVNNTLQTFSQAQKLVVKVKTNGLDPVFNVKPKPILAEINAKVISFFPTTLNLNTWF